MLLKYYHKIAYIVLETIIEIWWEWGAFYALPTVHGYHWSGGLAIFSVILCTGTTLLEAILPYY